MKRKIGSILSIFFVTGLVILGIIYAGLSIYYANTFMFGIFINGVYVTGKTVEEINEQLCSKVKETEVVVVDREGQKETILLDSIDFTYDYLDELKRVQKQQNPFDWLNSLKQYKDYTVSLTGDFNQEKLDKQLAQLKVVKQAVSPDKIRVEIVKSKKGYELIDTTDQSIDVDLANKSVGEALHNGVFSVNLDESQCYYQQEYTKKMQETLDTYKKLEKLIDNEIIYDFGAEEFVDCSVISDFITVDEEEQFVFDEAGDFIIDEDAVAEYIKGLADRYDTVNKERTFHATRGEWVTVSPGTYGNKINQKEEVEFLLEAIKNGTSTKREPVYTHKAWQVGDDDIGNTYIEVDLTEQKLYYYKNGRMLVSSDIVTGNISKGHNTPAKACYVYYMQRNRVLRGEDYATPVDYWIAVNGNIGIHDAKWRRSFGGKIYKTNGSHGCINTQYAQVSSLYEMVEIGTPVMIFY